MLQKTPLLFNFSGGLDLKTDPNQVGAGAFLSLQNSTFDKGGRLSKRNGFAALSTLAGGADYLTTFNGNLTAVSTSLSAYSQNTASWENKGTFIPLSLNTLPLVRNSTNQLCADSALANGMVCTVYLDSDGTNSYHRYVVADAITGQNLIPPTTLVGTASSLSVGTQRVFVLGNYFVVVFGAIVSATTHLQYIAINYNTLVVSPPVDLSSSYTLSNTGAFDGVVVGGVLYLAWSSVADGIQMLSLGPTLIITGTSNPDPAHQAGMFTLCGDGLGNIWVSYYRFSTSAGYSFRINALFAFVTPITQIITAEAVGNLASTSTTDLTFFYEVLNNYSYDSAIPTHFIKKNTLTTGAVLGTASVLKRSVGLASKAVLYSGVSYFLSTYQSDFQDTYFLLDGSGNIASKLAYENGGGYLILGLPTLQLSEDTLSTAYRFKDLIAAVNKGTDLASGTPTAGIYSQTGINLVSFNLAPLEIVSTEIGANLNLSGGFLWEYDGFSLTENGFFVYPDNVEATWSAIGGSIAAKPDGSTNTNAYFYQVTYEWTDNQGNAFRSAPSIPIPVTTTGALSTGSITVNIPTLRLTYKLTNPVKIVVYRWSVAQQVYYQVTSISNPTLNNPAVDSIAYVDTLADATILGNNILYTTGGVVENTAPPASLVSTLFDDRLWLIDAEDQNLLWYSKQVIEATPVEMSDLFTLFVAPSIGAQGSTGFLRCLAPMDDKLILFKAEAAYYINGSGPDNTGANDQYSQPIFITSSVGCSVQNSIVLIPEGLMFQSSKGIWLLGRDLSTQYIGSPVETYTQFNLALGTQPRVVSVLTEPGTNQVRFTMDTGVVLMYDYYFKQWGVFTGISAKSSTIYQSLHTFIDKYGRVMQETPGLYLDDTVPVIMQFTTGWLQLQKLQGFQRAYYFYILGNYISPHSMQISIAYDYQGPSQTTTLTPTNSTPEWGGDPLWGSSTSWGGGGDTERWRVFLQRGKCSAVQISIQESDSVGGGGFTLSGINMVIGAKKGYPTLRPSKSVG